MIKIKIKELQAKKKIPINFTCIHILKITMDSFFG